MGLKAMLCPEYQGDRNVRRRTAARPKDPMPALTVSPAHLAKSMRFVLLICAGYAMSIVCTHGFMNELLQNLVKLQELEFGEIKEKNADATIAKLRSKIPPQILGHFDRLVDRGKKGVAVVRDQVCTGCHLRLPIGVIMTLMHGEDIQLCDTCGRYLYLPEPGTSKALEPARPPKPAKKTRKPKRSLHAA